MSASLSQPSTGNPAEAAQAASQTGSAAAAHGVVGTEAHHVEPTALGMAAAAWVSLAMLVVIALLLWKKVPAAIGASLDKKIAAIRANLDEAAALRADAEKLKAEYEAKAEAAGKEAETMLAHAREEAEAIVAQARADAASLIERRGKIAEDKIAAAERSAVAEVRARAANAAAAAAARLIAERNDVQSDKALVDAAINALSTARLN
jgi:F-type H+-transporting ATPase subunit b